MEKIEFNRVVKGEEIKDMIEKGLGSKFRFKLKKISGGWGQIHIVQDSLRGCSVTYKEQEGRTICKVFPGPPIQGLLLLLAYTPTILIYLISIIFFGKIMAGLMIIVFFMVLPLILLWVLKRTLVIGRSGDIYQRVIGIIKYMQ